MSRFVNVAGGVVLACCLSQFPKFSQQYVELLSGESNALSVAVRKFDRSAEASGQTQAQALASLDSGAFSDRRRDDMHLTIARHKRLAQDYATLRDANVYVRLAYIARQPDTAVAARTWNDFTPSVPLTLDGMALTVVGYLGGYGLLGGLFALGRGRRNRRTA